MGTTADTLRHDLDRERADLTNDLQAIGDRVSPGRMVERRKAATRQRFGRISEQVMGSAHDVRDKASGMASDVGESTSGTISSVGDAMRDVPQRAEQMVEGNPLGAGIAAFGLGLVIATMMPETATEQRLVTKVEPKLQEAASTVGTAAQGVAEELKPAAKEAVQDLKSDAQDAAAQLKQQASDAASETAEQAKDKANEMRQQVKQ